MWASLWLVLSLTFITACTSKDSSGVATSGRISPTYQGPAETTYCASTTSYTGTTTTVTGTATFTRRNPWGVAGTGAGGLGSSSTLGTHPATNLPIRRAEVRVIDGSGAVVQCAETDNVGAFSFILPRSSTAYTVSINSRSSNAYMIASVLNRPEQNIFYSLTSPVTPSIAAVNLGTLTATSTTSGAMIAAAFNIYDQMLKANDYLRAQVSACGGTHAGCNNFTVAPKVVAYWEKGFNPNSYFNSTSGLSFYLPGYSRLFILGGQDGDVDTSDTDHFDNSVIIHEYGHFLEDSMFQSDSPGGSHNGDKVIDPRLAWSEGWGNFFQAAVRSEALYVDTLGNDDGSTHLIYYADLETASTGNDNPIAQGEGNFREFSVTRMLWDAIDAAADGPTHGATDNVVSAQFDEIWAALTKSTNGFNSTGWAFRSVGHLHYGQGLLGATNWSTIRTVEFQDGNTGEYASFYDTVANGATCVFVNTTYTKTITPVVTTSQTTPSDLFRNNDFYHIKITAGGSYTFRLEYLDTDGAGTKADLDLYLYNESARFGTSSDVLTKSNANVSTAIGAVETEQAPAITLAVGSYLLNVNAFVTGGGGVGTPAYYKILINGVQLCPDTL